MSDQLLEQMNAEASAEANTAPPVAEEVVAAAEVAVDTEIVAEADGESFTDEDRESMSKALRAERKRARDLEKQVKEFAAKQEAVDSADLSGQEKAVAEAVAAARADAKTQFDSQIVKLRVESKAAGMNFHDPSLAVSLIEVEADATDDELMDALKDLAADRPYLVKSSTPKMDMGPRPGKDGTLNSGTDEDWFRNLMAGQGR
jgi:hypothetical protein